MVVYFMLNVIHMQLYQLKAPNCVMMIQKTEKPNNLGCYMRVYRLQWQIQDFEKGGSVLIPRCHANTA